MAITCSRYCNDELFLTILNRFQITKGPHSNSEDVFEALVSCLVSLRSEEEIRGIIEKLTVENPTTSRNVSIHTESLMHLGSEFEYGCHNNMFFHNSKSIIGLLMALSNALNLRIFVICGHLPLRILHKDEYVLQFNFGDASADGIIIGLVGLTLLQA